MPKVTIQIHDDPDDPQGVRTVTEFDPAVEPADELTTAQEMGFAVHDFLHRWARDAALRAACMGQAKRRD